LLFIMLILCGLIFLHDLFITFLSSTFTEISMSSSEELSLLEE